MGPHLGQCVCRAVSRGTLLPRPPCIHAATPNRALRPRSGLGLLLLLLLRGAGVSLYSSSSSSSVPTPRWVESGAAANLKLPSDSDSDSNIINGSSRSKKGKKESYYRIYPPSDSEKGENSIGKKNESYYRVQLPGDSDNSNHNNENNSEGYYRIELPDNRDNSNNHNNNETKKKDGCYRIELQSDGDKSINNNEKKNESYYRARFPNLRSFRLRHIGQSNSSSRRSGKVLHPTLRRLGLSMDIAKIPNRLRLPKRKGLSATAVEKKKEKAKKLSLAHITASFLRRNPTVHSLSYADLIHGGNHDDSKDLSSSTALPWDISDEDLSLLVAGGYTVQDVLIWSYVLTAEDGGRSIRRLSKAVPLCGLERLPVFLLLHVFRHESGIRAKHVSFLRVLLNAYIEVHLVRRQRADEQEPGQGKYTDLLSQGLLVFRLVRMTSNYATHELNSMVNLMEKLLDGNQQSPRFACWLTNRILRELGKKPKSPNPYAIQSTVLLDAQYQILRFMAKSDPMISLTRTGFRGLIASSLAKKKDEATREEVRNMRPSWPPWQQKQDGWDQTHRAPGSGTSGIGSFGSTTEAGKILLETERAGYEFSDWERSALILAGREISGYPTIPTRRFIEEEAFRSINDGLVWLSRIQATRTLEEAWSLFMKYRLSGSRRGGRGNSGVQIYREIFEKALRYRTQTSAGGIQKRATDQYALGRSALPTPSTVPGKGFKFPKLKLGIDWVPPEPEKDEGNGFLYSDKTRIRGPSTGDGRPNSPDPLTVVAGDSLELQEPPRNPADRVYLSKPPLSSGMDMWDMMVRDGVEPDESTVAMFISYASKSADACALLERWEAMRSEKRREARKKRLAGLSDGGKATGGTSTAWFEDSDRTLQWWNVDEFVRYASSKTRLATATNRIRPPQELLCAFILCLTRYRQKLGWRSFPREFYEFELPFAVQLLRFYKPTLEQAWVAVMWALSHFHAEPASRRRTWDRQLGLLSPILHPQTSLDVLWRVHDTMLKSRDVRETMPMVEHLLYAATGQVRRYIRAQSGLEDSLPAVSRAIAAYERVVGMTDEEDGDEDGDNQGLAYQWEGEDLETMPQEIPETATIHSCVRLLINTRWKNHETLLETLRWMVKYKSLLQEKNRRLPLVAVRSLLEAELEHPEATNPDGRDDNNGDTQGGDVLSEARQIIEEGLDDWGGWPTDQEVNAYRGFEFKGVHD